MFNAQANRGTREMAIMKGSIDLSKSKKTDDIDRLAPGGPSNTDAEDAYDDEEDEVDEIRRDEDARIQQKSFLSVWSEGGTKKDNIIQKLISRFSMLLRKNEEDEIAAYLQENYVVCENDDIHLASKYMGDDGQPASTRDFIDANLDIPMAAKFSKLSSTTKALEKLIRAIIDNDNSETRDFTIFIGQKRFVRNILRPLLELCSEDSSGDIDVITVELCRKLVYWLIKDMSAGSKKALEFDPLKPNKELLAEASFNGGGSFWDKAIEKAAEKAAEKDGENAPNNKEAAKPVSRKGKARSKHFDGESGT